MKRRKVDLPRGRRKREKAEDESDVREFLASVPRPISTQTGLQLGVLYMEHNAMGVVMAE